MYTLYNFLITFGFILLFPYLFIRAVLGGHGVRERLGIFPEEIKQKFSQKKVIWFHAASVGEVRVLSTILFPFKNKNPNIALVVSTLTKSGKKEAERVLKEADFVFYSPIDLAILVRKTLKIMNPQALILVETELWPNLIKEAQKNKSLVALINGRISTSSFFRYLKFKGFFSTVFSFMDMFLMQSSEDAERISRLGADKSKVQVIPNLKFDRMLKQSQEIDKRAFKKRLGLSNTRQILVAGSTREGEEKIILEVFKKLKTKQKNLLLLLAPRHLNRLKKIQTLLSNYGFRFIKRTDLDGTKILPLNTEVILLDTIGELAQLYAIADVAFVGGSLLPFGGHNLLEPAIYGVPVVFGSHIEHFQNIAQLLTESDAGIQINHPDELYTQISFLLKDEKRNKQMGQNAKAAIKEKSGASLKTVNLLFDSLERKNSR